MGGKREVTEQAKAHVKVRGNRVFLRVELQLPAPLRRSLLKQLEKALVQKKS
jgi:hypothetical protein